MRRKTLLTSYAAALAIVFGFVTMASLLRAGSKNAPSRFNNESGEDGAVPYAGVIFDGAGNLYGATTSGGAYGGGTVFQLVPKNDTWTENILYSFCRVNGCPDGGGPYAALIFDEDGNLYGTTSEGGPYNLGAVFRLAPENGTWTETVLHGFDRKDGAYPAVGLIFDAAGNLYGTTARGGASGKTCAEGKGCGTVFELTPGASGAWTETVLHSFNDDGKDGNIPNGLIFDAAGNLYGTTWYGGRGSCDDEIGHGCGTVFELTPGASGAWTETILHSFNRKDGYNPAAALVFDAVGNLYGVTNHGGALGKGTVFQLSRSAGGTWTETLLHSFQNDGKDGFFPYGTLIFDMNGNLYGTTSEGSPDGDTCGGLPGCGTVFQLVYSANGKWREKVLHGFNGSDGLYPVAGPIFGADGALYGTAAYGGNVKQCSGNGCGTVFRLAPGTNGNWAEKVLHKFSFD